MDLTELFPWLVGAGTLITILFVIVAILCSMVPFVAILGGAFWFISRRSKQASQLNQASLNWPSTSGTVLKARVQVSGGEYTTVSPYVEYEYEVSGVAYVSTSIQAGDSIMKKYTTQSAYDTVDLYPVGANVTVYYNPADPTESALER